MPKVSIIVPCYNQAQFLEEALQSVLEQTYQNWECIIVNDGSLDHTEAVAREWLVKDSRYKYIYKENGGLSSARNAGIAKAMGEFILTLDADDKYETTFMEKALDVMVNNSGVGIVSSWGIRFMEEKRFGEFRPTGGSLNDFLFCNAAIGTSLFRKECWIQAGGYDENMKKGYEDWEFYIRVCQYGWNVHIIEEVLFFYRQHAVSMRTVAVKSYDKEIKEYIYLKHKEMYQSNYESLIIYFLTTIEAQKKETINVRKKIEFRLGTYLLKPLRTIKSFFR